MSPGSPLSQPSDEDLAAIIAAVEAVWPRPQPAEPPPFNRPSPWRFSGRWWARPIPMRRERPWLR